MIWDWISGYDIWDLFWYSKSGRITNFDIRSPTLISKLRPNIEFWHSKFYLDFQTGAEYRIMTSEILFWYLKWSRISNLTFKILFWHSHWDRISDFETQIPISPFNFRPNIEFWHSKSYFDIRNETEYRKFTFEILFQHSNWGQISYFDIPNPITTFELMPNIVIWHSKFYFDIRIEAEYRILIFEILFWHSNWGWISNFDIRKLILTL